jgi:hypothetical protein
LFSWFLLFLMMVMMMLWMKKERAAMPDKAGNVAWNSGVKWMFVTLMKSTLMPKLADLMITKSSIYITDSVPVTQNWLSESMLRDSDSETIKAHWRELFPFFPHVCTLNLALCIPCFL